MGTLACLPFQHEALGPSCSGNSGQLGLVGVGRGNHSPNEFVALWGGWGVPGLLANGRSRERRSHRPTSSVDRVVSGDVELGLRLLQPGCLHRLPFFFLEQGGGVRSLEKAQG